MTARPLRIGTAGWSIPARYAADVPAGGSQLERYARALDAAEINSIHPSTGRIGGRPMSGGQAPHRRLPLLGQAAEDHHPFRPAQELRCHAWLCAGPGRMARRAPAYPRRRRSRANAQRGRAGGWNGLVYYRWHGSPRTYYSSYDDAALAALRHRLDESVEGGAETWCIFDNTASGAPFERACPGIVINRPVNSESCPVCRGSFSRLARSSRRPLSAVAANSQLSAIKKPEIGVC
jgi:hypothetical protein